MTPRVRRTFWALVIVAVLSAGALSTALDAPPAPATGLTVASSALSLAATTFLALRILVVVRRATGRELPPRE